MTAQTGGVQYQAWNPTSKKVENAGACASYNLVTADDTTWGTAGQSTWYVLSGETPISNTNRITVNGTVNLILCDGATLTANQGITVAGSNTLNIYAQSTGEDKGRLIAGEGERGDGCAGIGGDTENSGCGVVNIHGGTVEARGGNDWGFEGGDGWIESDNCGGAGIGGGSLGVGSSVSIYSGTVVTAAGQGAEGIGSGGGLASKFGSLRLGADLALYSGDESDPTTLVVFESGTVDYERSRYMTAIDAVEGVEKAVGKLPASDAATTADKEAIENARRAYDLLTADQKERVDQGDLNKP